MKLYKALVSLLLVALLLAPATVAVQATETTDQYEEEVEKSNMSGEEEQGDYSPHWFAEQMAAEHAENISREEWTDPNTTQSETFVEPEIYNQYGHEYRDPQGMAPAATISLRIHGYYWSAQYGGNRMCQGALVQLFSQGWFGDNLVKEGYTDSSGDVVFNVNPGKYKVTLYCDDHKIVKIRTNDWIGEACYRWSTSFIDTGSGNPTWSIYIGANDNNKEVWDGYQNIRDAWTWLYTHSADNGQLWPCPHVSVYFPVGWPDPDWPHSHGNVIHLGPSHKSALSNPRTMHHEWAHCVMWHVHGGHFPPINGQPDPHYIDTEAKEGSGTNWGFAYIEGWAIFLPAAIANDPWRTSGGSLEYGGSSYSNLYADGCYGHGNYGDWDGWDVEGAVASVLWDIYDGSDSGDRPSWSSNGDHIDREFNKLWHVFHTYDINNMWDFYSAWVVSYGSSSDLYNICYNHRMDRNNTTDT